MHRSILICTTGLLISLASVSSGAAEPETNDNPHLVVWEGEDGPGRGKHVVLIAGDHEYRGEETLPALARILAKHYGFKTSCFITTDPKTGFIRPGSSHLSGLETLRTADLLVVFLRFQDFKDEEMQHIVDYLDAGKPVLGLRTSTHAFKIGKGKKFHKYSDNYRGEDYFGGFGEQVLGEHWVGHYGRNHRQSSRLILEKDQLAHPVLRGVKDVHAQCGGYNAHPIEGSTILARGQILNGMTADSEPDPTKEILPVAWIRTHRGAKSGTEGRVFTTTHGASEDILNDGFRRMLVNGALWCVGLENEIRADGPIGFVGPYHPVTFSFGGYRKGIRPKDLEGWDTPILGASDRTHLFILSGQSNMAGLDPSVSFTPTVARAFAGDEVIVVKDAQGGQPIRRWWKEWKPAAGTEPKATGDLYDRLLAKVKSSVGDRKPTTISFVWMQGERDAREKHGDVYRASLEGLVAQLRGDLGREDVQVVIGRLSDFDNENERYPHWTRVREAQTAFAETNPRYGWIDTDDLNGPKDELHYTKKGYRTLGRRFAQKVVELVEKNRE